MADRAFKNTTATKKIFQLNKRIRAVSGGTSASKTISILVWLIDYSQSTSNKIVTVVAESVPHLMLGAIRDFKNIMSSNGYWDENSWNETKHTYVFPGDTLIEFISFDKFGKAHGPRRDVLFCNECNNLPHPIVDQLITRTREVIWLDWNPSEEFWFYTEIQGKRDDVDFITLTYKDNEALDEITIKEIESHKSNKSWWKVYGEGQLGVTEGRIYRDWKIIDEIPHEARLMRRGLDFGYTNDPSALIDIYKYNGGFIFDENLYQKGLSNRQIADRILISKEPYILVKADSAEPKSIDEIKGFGIDIIGANKGPGSVKQGIQYVQDQRCSVTSRSLNLLKDYRNYKWKVDKNGNILNEPEHTFSHSLDAIRYGLEDLNPEVTMIFSSPSTMNDIYSPI